MGILKVLFVCARNLWRSPTAEKIYCKDPRLEVKSAGLHSSAKRVMSLADVSWADVILVMEDKHKKQIQEQFPNVAPAKIYSLNIPDDYKYMDDDLIKEIESATDPILFEIFRKQFED